MKKNLYDFLNGDDERVQIHQTDYEHSNTYTYFTKVSSGIKDISLIYKINTTVKDVFPLFGEMKFMGIFRKLTKVFYYSSFLDYYNRTMDCSDLNMVNIGDLAKELDEEIKAEIIKKVGYNEDYLCVKLSEDEIKRKTQFIVPQKALELFMENKEVDRYEYLDAFSLPQIEYSGALLLLYLDNPDRIIKEKFNEFLDSREKYIYENIVINKLVEKEMEKLNKDKSLHKRREIASILSDKSRKTLNVEFFKDGKTLECKTETDSRYLNQDSVWSMFVSNLSDREKFEEMFKNSSGDASYNDIKKITYSRKILYLSEN